MHAQDPSVRITQARMEDSLGLRLYRVTEALVEVTGECLFFGSDVNIGPVDMDVSYGYIRETFPMWWRVAGPSGSTFRLEFGRPGLVAPVSGVVRSGALEIQGPRVQLSASQDLMIETERPDLLQPAVQGSEVLYPIVRPVTGLPGVRIGSGVKPGSVQGLAGYTPLFVLPPQPMYILLTYSAPPCGECLDQPLTPSFLCLRSPDYSPRFPGAPAAGGVKLGDLSVLAQPNKPFSMVVISLDNILEVGVWFADLEDACVPGPDATGVPYSDWNVSAYALLEGKTTPLSGGGTELCTGIVRATLPGVTSNLSLGSTYGL